MTGSQILQFDQPHFCSGKVFIFGGRSKDSCFNEMWQLDLTTLNWTKLTFSGDFPSPRAFHTCIVQGNNFFLFGGEALYKNLGTGESFNDLYMFLPSANKWIKIYHESKSPNGGSAPTLRHAHTCIIYKAQLFIYGGLWRKSTGSEEETTVEPDLFVYNSPENKWIKHRPTTSIRNQVPPSLFGHTSILLHNSKIFNFGGFRDFAPISSPTTNHHNSLVASLPPVKDVSLFPGLCLRKFFSNDIVIFYHLDHITADSHHHAPGKSPSSGDNVGSGGSGGSGSDEGGSGSPSVAHHGDLPTPAPTHKLVGGVRGLSSTALAGFQKIKKKNSTTNLHVGSPFNMKHKAHVGFDFKWSGENSQNLFVVDRELGEGAYGKVYKGIHKETGFTLAIKEISLKNATEHLELTKEITWLKELKHQNLVSYFGSLVIEEKMWILMELCELGSVRDVIEFSQKTFPEREIGYICYQTLCALQYIHSKNIMHRDIKVFEKKNFISKKKKK
jgi:hypothetical protein